MSSRYSYISLKYGSIIELLLKQRHEVFANHLPLYTEDPRNASTVPQ